MALIALFFKNEAAKAIAASILSKTQVKDAPLAAKQDQLKQQISDIDKSIQDRMNEHDKMTDQEKADKWNK